MYYQFVVDPNTNEPKRMLTRVSEIGR